MKISDSIKAIGHFKFELVGPDGKVKQVVEKHNLVVTVGKNFIASRVIGTADAVMSHCAIGSSSTAAAAGDTALGAELGRVALGSATRSNNVVTYTASFGAGVGTGTVREAGIFNATPAGTMLNRTVVADIPKGAADTLNVTVTLTIS